MNRKLVITGLGILGLLLLFYLRGCNNQPTLSGTQQNTKKESSLNGAIEIPETFPEFYQTFHTDSLYQMSHILWPLKQQVDGSPWSQSDWELHGPFDNSSGEFTRDLDNFAGIITETISHNQGYFHMIRRFSQMNGEWYLIYYTVESIANEGEG